MLKNNNPSMEGFRKWELHDPKDVATPSGEKTLEPPSFENAVMSLTGFQIADGKVQQGCSTGRYHQTVDDSDSVSSGSMSPDLGDLWRQGCSQSPEWEGEWELDFTEEEEGEVASHEEEIEGEGLEDYLKQVIESQLWVLVRDFVTSGDVLEMRTSGH